MKTQTLAMLGTTVAVAAALLAAQPAHAGNYCWSGNVKLYGSTTAGWGATGGLGGLELAASYNGGNHPWCVNRYMINKADTAMWSLAMAAWLSGKRIGVCYTDEATDGVWAHGTYSASCKIYHMYPAE